MCRWIVGVVAIASLWATVADARPRTAAHPAKAPPPPRCGHTLDIGLVSGTAIVTPPGKVHRPPTHGATATQLLLAGGDRSVCSVASGAHAASKALPHRVLRLLGARGHGRFQTKGLYAAATVRGTVWTTTDYCDGTLVSVRRGVVSVRDLVAHRTIAVSAGHRYFAKAP